MSTTIRFIAVQKAVVAVLKTRFPNLTAMQLLELSQEIITACDYAFDQAQEVAK